MVWFATPNTVGVNLTMWVHVLPAFSVAPHVPPVRAKGEVAPVKGAWLMPVACTPPVFVTVKVRVANPPPVETFP